ncbi:MAG: proline--tRNA ligase [Clostridiales bacterium]|nr:proline--tRNA ligase [Clostridiales bacterium]
MKVRNILGERFKERAFDIESQNLMTRGGYMKQVGNGIYSLFTPTKRIQNKIEAILREEMDAIDGQEVLFPVVMPATLWQSSGRFESIGQELLRFKDRSGADMVLGMTHEEAAVQMAMNVAGTYQKYPFMIYQIQTKFRDEPRARGGLIRVREFTMKDGYSFHTSQEDLERYYDRAFRAYERIYARAGVPEVLAVKSDSGMMGGKISHEFMLLCDIGEDSIVICPECGFRANMEACEAITENTADAELLPLEEVFTGEAKTIEEVAGMLHLTADKTCKAVVYQRNEDDSYVLVFCRGDRELNETKLTNYIKAKIHPAVDIENANLTAGNIGPVGLDAKATVLFDRSLVGATNLVCGANKEEYHLKGFNPARDLPEGTEFIDLTKAVEGGICPVCGKHTLTVRRGIEVGNIFQLGKRYTEAMGMTYDSETGERRNPIMGCYGIGVGRLIASVCEAHHDDYGPIWPITIAPWQVEICALRINDETVKAAADKLYADLEKAGAEVLYDDRPVSAGVMFSDADLLSAPVRVVISPKTLARGCVELVARDKSFTVDASVENAAEAVMEKIRIMTEAVLAKVPERK